MRVDMSLYHVPSRPCKLSISLHNTLLYPVKSSVARSQHPASPVTVATLIIVTQTPLDNTSTTVIGGNESGQALVPTAIYLGALTTAP